MRFHLISAPLTNIINLSLQKGIFPDKLKIAKVIPMYKANDPSIFTKLKKKCIIAWLNSPSNIIYRCQFEFRKTYSTSHALIHLINRISSAIDQRETTVRVFLDLFKAFDSLDQINQTCSSMQIIKCGVPQGSILGPLFFILYINYVIFSRPEPEETQSQFFSLFWRSTSNSKQSN